MRYGLGVERRARFLRGCAVLVQTSRVEALRPAGSLARESTVAPPALSVSPWTMGDQVGSVSGGGSSTVGSSTAEGGGSSSSSKRPLFRFGLIADIQYADIEDAENFAGTEKRWYRGSLQGARRAVEAWRLEEPAELDFVAQLGDLVDGQNAGEYGAGLRWRGNPQSDAALRRVVGVLDGAPTSTMYHAVGNHELMNFELGDFVATLAECGGSMRHVAATADGRAYYVCDGFPRHGWTCLMLNSYETSLMLPKDSDGYARAASLLRKHNPNDVVDTPQGTVDYFTGLDGPDLRFVPFNGGFGPDQLDWLERKLQEARHLGLRVLLFSHVPVHSSAATFRNVAFDAPEIKALIAKYSDSVVALFAGHSHKGGFHLDPDTSVAHLTVPATLTHHTSFGVCDVYADSIHLRGFGDLPSRHLDCPCPSSPPLPPSSSS